MIKQKLYQRVAESIATAIAKGRYAPGSRLPAERDLAEEFKVSRPTIREAMIALEIRGLVGAKKGSGIYVTATDKQFHLAIAKATGNSVVVSVVEMLWTIREQSPLCVHMFAKARREGVTPRVNEHQLIVDALAARDPQLARETMRSHLRRVTDDLLEATRLDMIQKAHADFAAQRQRVVSRGSL